MTLKGKRAVVTGGARGIGAGIARRLAAEGADVAITYAGNEDAAKAVVAAIEATGQRGIAIKADAADPTAQAAGIDEAAGTLGGIDILVHNAGTAVPATIADETQADYERIVALNIGGVHSGTKAALPHIADGGRIIIVGSVSGDKALFPGMATYSATKAAVQALARGWALDLASRGILVNVIQPGPIATDLNPEDGEMAAVVKPLIALGRYGTVEEVAGVAAFLAGDDSTFITGASIDVSGGSAL